MNRITVRIEKDMHRELKIYCCKRGTTLTKVLNDYIVELLGQARKDGGGHEELS